PGGISRTNSITPVVRNTRLASSSPRYSNHCPGFRNFGLAEMMTREFNKRSSKPAVAGSPDACSIAAATSCAADNIFFALVFNLHHRPDYSAVTTFIAPSLRLGGGGLDCRLVQQVRNLRYEPRGEWTGWDLNPGLP